MNDWTDNKTELIKYLKELDIHPIPNLNHDELLSIYNEFWKTDPRQMILDRKLNAMRSQNRFNK